jgi:hypothetical protein
VIARAQRVDLAGLEIVARGEVGFPRVVGEDLGERSLVQRGIEDEDVDDRVVGGTLVPDLGEFGRVLGQGTVEVTPQFKGMVRRLGGDERIAGVEIGFVDLGEVIAMPGIGARLGENLNAAEADLVILRGVGVLIHPDFADGVFRRKAAAGKSVDVEIGSGVGIRAGDHLELLGQLIGIVGERVEVGAFEDDGVAILIGAGVDGVGVDGDLLLLNLDDQRQGELTRFAGLNSNALNANRAKSRRAGRSGINPRPEAGNVEVSLRVGRDGERRGVGPGASNGDGRARNDSAGGIDYRAGKSACGLGIRCGLRCGRGWRLGASRPVGRQDQGDSKGRKRAKSPHSAVTQHESRLLLLVRNGD